MRYSILICACVCIWYPCICHCIHVCSHRSLFRKSKALGVIDQSNNKHMGVCVFHHQFSIQCSLFPQGLCCGVDVGNGLFPFGEQRPALHRFRSG